MIKPFHSLQIVFALLLCVMIVNAQSAKRGAQPVKTAAAATEAASVKTEKSGHHVSSLNIKVLSTQVADDGIGEWGYAAIVEADGHRILFDTGARTETVLTNAKELDVDLSDVKDVILSHNHDDHTNGLITLRKSVMRKNRQALSVSHVGKGIFYPRPQKSGREGNSMLEVKPAYQALGGKFIEYSDATELYPGIWLTGNVKRTYPERNWSGDGKVETPEGIVEDNIPEDLSLVIDTDQGLVIISGCGHAGIINTIEHARKTVREAPALAVIGGFHLFESSDETLDWTASKLREFGTKNLMGGHCTGLEAVYRIRQKAGLDRKTCVVSSVGSSFSLEKGINPGALAQ